MSHLFKTLANKLSDESPVLLIGIVMFILIGAYNLIDKLIDKL